MTTADVDQPWQVWLAAGALALAIHGLALAVLPGRGPGGGGHGAPAGQGVLVLKGVTLPSVELRASPVATQAALVSGAAPAPVAAPPQAVAAASLARPANPPVVPTVVAGTASPSTTVTPSPAAPLTATVPSAAAIPIPSSLVTTTEAPAVGATPASPRGATPIEPALAAAAPALATTAGSAPAPAPAVLAAAAPPALPVRVVAASSSPGATGAVAAAAAPVRVAPSTTATPAVAAVGTATAAPVTTLRPATAVVAAMPSVTRPLAGALDCGLAGAAAETFCVLVAGVPVGAEGRTELGLRPTDGVFFADDYLVVNVRLPVSLGGGHLYVSYLDHTGEIVHLRPNALSAETEVPAGARLRLGADADQRREGVRDWRFEPPFGQGLIVAWLTRRPLPLFPRPEVEPAGPFLAEVKEALAAAELVWAAHRPLESRPRS